MKVYNIAYKKDARLLILTVALFHSCNVFFYFSIINRYYRRYTFFLIGDLRYLIMLLVCYYYIYKAQSLWPYKRARTVFIVSGILFFALDIFLNVSNIN